MKPEDQYLVCGIVRAHCTLIHKTKLWAVSMMIPILSYYMQCMQVAIADRVYTFIASAVNVLGTNHDLFHSADGDALLDIIESVIPRYCPVYSLSFWNATIHEDLGILHTVVKTSHATLLDGSNLCSVGTHLGAHC